ncbi:MAG: hypothetical protein UHG68_03305 [Clostridia bacterium]|nr:hypothetical protein [Clostridia bacterium]
MNADKNIEIENYCAFCEHSTATYDKDRMLCEKKGIVYAGYVCRKFRYDPQKRVPVKKRLISISE